MKIGSKASAEEQLRQERAFFQQLMDTVPDKIYFKDLKSRFLRINRAHARQFGLKAPSDAVGKTDFDFFAEVHAKIAFAEEQEIIRTGKAIVNKEEHLIMTDGQESWSSTTKAPLRNPDGEITGTFGISRDITERKNAEQELLRKNAEMAADLKVAREIQQSFLSLNYPVFPPGAKAGEEVLTFSHRYLPADTLAGDFFEIFQIDETTAGILICDVMGHGVRASLVTAFLRGLVEEILPRAREPGAFLTEINRGMSPLLRHADSPMFVTAFYCVVDTNEGCMRYSNAGHPMPFILRRGASRVERLQLPAKDPEPATGLIDDFAYSTAETGFSRNDVAVLFTDGLFEAKDKRGRPFGEIRLRNQLKERLKLNHSDLLETLTQAVKTYAGTDTFQDDVCIVAVKAGASYTGVR